MGGCESSEPVELSFAAESSLRDVLATALPACAALALPGQAIARVAIIVEELLANIYDHGGMQPGGVVTLCFVVEPKSVRLTLQDPGQPFDPRNARTDAPIPERGGGAGINLLRSWATILSYQAGPPVNRLEVLVPIDRT